MTRANVVEILGQVGVTLGALVVEVGPRLGSVLVRMFGLVIGTVLPVLVGHTTLLVGPAASSVEHLRMTHLGAMTLTSHAQEVLELVAVAAVAVAVAVLLDLDGNLVTGFAIGDFIDTHILFI